MSLESDRQTFVDSAILFADIMAQVGLPIKFHEYMRPPERQNELYSLGRTRARAWESPHQYGLAADFSFDPYGYDVPFSWWQYADKLASHLGIQSGISYGDANHIQLPGWQQWKKTSFWSRLWR